MIRKTLLKMTSLRILYNTNGFVSGLPLLMDTEIDSMRQELTNIEQNMYNGKFAPQTANLHLKHEFIWKLATHPVLIEYIKEIFDEEYAIVDSILFTKYPQMHASTKEYIAYHQDLTYWDINPKRIMAVWIALDHANIQSGTMNFIPGSHKYGQLKHDKARKIGNLLGENQKISDEHMNDLNPDSSNIVANILKPGQVSFHDGYLVHGSPPNLSMNRRCGLNFIVIDLNTQLGEWKYSDKYMQDTRRPIIISGTKKLGKMTYFPPPNFTKSKL